MSQSGHFYTTDGLFYTSDAAVDLQFMMRYTTQILSLIEFTDDACTAAKRCPYESLFYLSAHEKNWQSLSESARILQDAHFISRLTQRCCFSLTTMVGALDYFRRLKEGGAVRLSAGSWKSVFVTCCLLSEKMWEDNFVHPHHIVSQYAGYCHNGHTHSRRDYMEMQLATVNVLDWRTNVSLPQYHKYMTAIFDLEVPALVLKAVQRNAGNGAFVPRPLPALPKMILPKMADAMVHRNINSKLIAKQQQLHHQPLHRDSIETVASDTQRSSVSVANAPTVKTDKSATSHRSSFFAAFR